jgi:hypothetical protein
MRSRLTAATILACAAAACSLPAGALAAPAPSGGLSATNALGAPHGMGLIARPSAPASANAIAKVQASAAALPASVDLTPYAMPAGNQGQVGSCAAWASDYSALGYWENKQKIVGGALQPMYTYSQVDGGVDEGSYIEANLLVDQQQGIDNQSDYYQGQLRLPRPAQLGGEGPCRQLEADELERPPGSGQQHLRQPAVDRDRAGGR